MASFGRKSLLSLNSWGNGGGGGVGGGGGGGGGAGAEAGGGGGGGGGKRRSNSNTSCKAAAALAATASSMVDFWGRVSQQMAYIDGSTRSSSLVGSLQNDGSGGGTVPPAEMVSAGAAAAAAAAAAVNLTLNPLTASGAAAAPGACAVAPPPPLQPPPAPPPRHPCRRHTLASAASCASCTTCSYSSASTASPSPPASPPASPQVSPSPSPRVLRRQKSICDDEALVTRPPTAKGSIYENYFHYPDDEEDDDAVELQMLQPLAPREPLLTPPPPSAAASAATASPAAKLPSSSTFASAVTDTGSAGGGGGGAGGGGGSTGGGSGRGRFKKYQKQMSLCGRDCRCAAPPDQYGIVSRKASSWEESEALQRRRSVMLSGAGGALGLGLGLGGGVGGTEGGGRGGVASCPVVVPSSSELQLLDKHDLRYYFQHPYPRLFVTYFVIFCNFLLFAEDPISHSHTESDIPMVGNVFSFVLTKYPPEWRWSLIKVLMWILAILCGMILGKLLIHGYLCGTLLRLKMFRDDQGSWMTMFLTVIVSLYVFSHAYNLLLMLWYENCQLQINSQMGVTNASVMKAAACGTWLGDLITALMVTDMMLQDNLYPHWAPRFRQLWRRSNVPRILIFWVGSVVATSVVVTLIVSDWISWDHLNRDFLATTELSRAFLASFILVMDLLIVMQDWDFPHFTTTLHVNLPGFSVATLQWKYAEVDVTGKWFNYGIIFLVMLLDLNMWKNQIFYDPRDFGQYTGPDDKVRTINDPEILEKANASLWTWEVRSQIDVKTNLPYHEQDMQMNSRYMNYPLSVKWTAFIPSGIGLIMFVALVSLYGRFPSNQAHHLADRTHASCRLVKPDKELGDIPAPASR
ncbi:hypothetical protein R5R35_014216 [Gryllus longicercus]|uniref:Transmembrane protein 117 n=1 Tax=Gryllus longicercus TaxID=2509291 RepID=A0AAN9Z979_9ORTH